VGCAPPRPNNGVWACPSGVESDAVRLVCDVSFPPTRVTLERERRADTTTETLTLLSGGRPTWQTSASYAATGGDQFKLVLGFRFAGGARLVYSVMHCPSQCLTADLVVLANLDQQPSEVFRSGHFGARACRGNR
jgi:hypothetical protein